MIDDAEDKERGNPRCWMMERSNLFGRVGMIICWYWDDTEDFPEFSYAIRGVSLISALVTGETQDFSSDDWWIFFDAIGSYVGCMEDPEPELVELSKIASQGYFGGLPPGPTKNFFADYDDE